jgi:cytoskeletal protein RodZ
MNRKSEPDNNLNDKDIAALFDQQEIVVPRALDAAILKASRQVEVSTPQSKSPMKKYSSWFAAAAVVVLAVTLAPLLLNAPQSQLQEDRPFIIEEINAEDTSEGVSHISAAALDSTAKSASETASETASESASETASESASVPASVPASEPAPIPAPKPIPESVPKPVAEIAPAPTIQRKASNSSTPKFLPIFEGESVSKSIAADELHSIKNAAPILDSFSGPASFTGQSSKPIPLSIANEFDYRLSPETWLSRIKDLLARNFLPEAKVEYDLFRVNHPTFEKDFVLPEQ